MFLPRIFGNYFERHPTNLKSFVGFSERTSKVKEFKVVTRDLIATGKLDENGYFNCDLEVNKAHKLYVFQVKPDSVASLYLCGRQEATVLDYKTLLNLKEENKVPEFKIPPSKEYNATLSSRGEYLYWDGCRYDNPHWLTITGQQGSKKDFTVKKLINIPVDISRLCEEKNGFLYYYVKFENNHEMELLHENGAWKDVRCTFDRKIKNVRYDYGRLQYDCNGLDNLLTFGKQVTFQEFCQLKDEFAQCL